MNIKPLSDKLLLKIQDSEEKTSSGLFIPQTAQEKTQRGIVVEMSESIKDDCQINKGDKVMFNKYAGTPIKIEGADHLILSFEDLIAIIVD